MNNNLTLLGQSITFVIFVWFCMRFAWPPIKAMMPLSYDLSTNIQLNTFETWSPNVLLLRLAHQFAVDEDTELSAPVTIDLSTLLSRYDIKSVTEMSLSVNQEKQTMLANKIQWSTANDAQFSVPLQKSLGNDDYYEVTLNAMEIRTFLVHV